MGYKYFNLCSTFFKALYNLALIHPCTHTHTPMAESYRAKCWSNQREQFGARFLTQGHEGGKDSTANPAINGQPALPTEPQLLPSDVCFTVINKDCLSPKRVFTSWEKKRQRSVTIRCCCVRKLTAALQVRHRLKLL